MGKPSGNYLIYNIKYNIYSKEVTRTGRDHHTGKEEITDHMKDRNIGKRQGETEG